MSDLDKYSDVALASVVTGWEMPDFDVSERTQAAREIGAFEMMKHLLGGDWEPGSQAVMQEFLGRVVTNATRQGINIESKPNV